MSATREITVVGAGLAGSLLAILLARRGFKVCVYERRPDLRIHAIPAGRSINLALAHRGMRPLEAAGVLGKVDGLLIPLRGRMLHAPDGHLLFVPYGRTPREVIYSISRTELNRRLLDAAETAGVRIQFNQRCDGVDCANGTVRFTDIATNRPYTVTQGPVIATDGAGSTVRQAMAKELGLKVTEDILPHGYKELGIPAGPHGAYQMAREALHIWPRGGHMLIALPNLDGSFTVTLFLAHQGAPSLTSLQEPQALRDFFSQNFPDALQRLPDLEHDFLKHPTGMMGTLHCPLWHARGRVLLLGDAAHAIVPFHGQGMNCAFEDCLILDHCIGSFDADWERVFLNFEIQRRPDTEAIAAMALENYLEMRDGVRDPKHHLQKRLGFVLEERHPGIFIPRYSMVMFHHLPYSEARRRGALQQDILDTLTARAKTIEEVDMVHADKLIQERLSRIAVEP